MIRMKSDRQNTKTFARISGLPNSASKGIRSAFYEIGGENVNHLRKLIRSKDKTGRLYGNHRASAPGEAPAAQPNSRLTKGLRYTVRGDYQMEFGDTAPYGGYLEEGTKNMAARPHVSRTVREKQRDARNTFRKYLDPKRMLA